MILGAGLDTYAQRHPHMDVLEIDHPATQNWKRRLLHERGFDLPTTLAFLPVDFERASLADTWPSTSLCGLHLLAGHDLLPQSGGRCRHTDKARQPALDQDRNWYSISGANRQTGPSIRCCGAHGSRLRCKASRCVRFSHRKRSKSLQWQQAGVCWKFAQPLKQTPSLT